MVIRVTVLKQMATLALLTMAIETTKISVWPIYLNDIICTTEFSRGTRCDDALVTERASDFWWIMSCCYNGAGVLAVNLICTLADTFGRKPLYVFCSVCVLADNVSCVLLHDKYLLLLSHSVFGAAGNLYVLLALGYAMVADGSHASDLRFPRTTPTASPLSHSHLP